MAYVDQVRGGHRTATLALVATLHAGAIYALVTGLAFRYAREVMPVFEAYNIPLDIPEPPAPVPRSSANPEPDRPDRDVIQRDQRVPDLGGTVLEGPVPQPSPVPTDTIEPVPPPRPVPSFAPRFARPRGDQATWVTPGDYPARDLREGNQGRVSFALLVSAEGRPESCVVTGSSGHTGLDDATCRTIMRRARFTPATDEAGRRVAGSYAGSIRWEIPEA